MLVVIAIIGVLASVVLAATNSARNKGNDSSVKSNLANTRSQAEIFYNDNRNSYYGGTAATDVCSSTGVAANNSNVKGIYNMVLAAAKVVGITSVTQNAASTSTTATCNSSATAWAAEVPLKQATGYWCADSTGISRNNTSAGLTTTTDYTC